MWQTMLAILLALTSLSSHGGILQQHRLTKLIESDNSVNVSLWVQNLNHHKPLYHYRDTQMRVPASTQKLFTAAAAVRAFGPDHTFTTSLHTWHHPQQHHLKGPVQLVFDGDPTLTHEQLTELFKQLHASGVNQIDGDIRIDDHKFDHAGYGPGWMWDELDDCYAAPVSAAMVDKNCFTASIYPSKRLYQPAHIRFSTPYHQKFVSHVKTLAHKTDQCEFKFNPTAGPSSYSLNGCVRLHQAPENLQVAVKQPRHYLVRQLQQSLHDAHIKLNGHIHFALTPHKKRPTLQLQHASAPLSSLINEMLKHSDNLIADSLFKSIGYQRFHRPSSWQLSQQALRHYLPLETQTLAHAELDDGAGLSRYNELSAQQIGSLLQVIYDTPSLKQTIYPALPIWGVDGTLKHRTDPLLKHIIHAKTGGMHEICNLAGYLETAKHQQLGFVIMMRGDTKDHQKIRNWQSELLHTLYNS